MPTGPGFKIAGGGQVVELPDLAPKGSEQVGGRRALMGKEIGTQFDWGQRLFAYYGEGDVFDYGQWTSRDMKTMFSRNGLCAAIAQALTLPVRGAPIKIDPAKGDTGEAEFIESVLLSPDEDGGMRTPITELVGQITSAQIYRRAFFEKVYKIRDADEKIIYDKIAFRPGATCQARFNDRTSEPNGFRQQVWLFGGNLMLAKNQKVPGYVDIPRMRSYIYTHGKWQEPLTGVSEMEVSYWCHQTQMKLLYLWYHFLENQALPRTIVYGDDQPEANARADDIAALKSSGVVGLIRPSEGGKAFETIESGGNAGEFFAGAMTFLENWMTSSVLAGFLQLTGAVSKGRSGGGSSSSGGSNAMSQDQSSYYLKSRTGIATEMADSISHDIIRPLIVLNYGSRAAFPKWSFGQIQDESSQALLTLFGQIVAAPAMNIPIPVFDLITERMAGILGLDPDAVKTALVSTANQRADQLAGNPPPGMPPEAAGQLGALQGLASAAHGIAAQAAPGGVKPPPPPGAVARNPAAGPLTKPPPMIPPPGKMA
jgi:hypothetical protein